MQVRDLRRHHGGILAFEGGSGSAQARAGDGRMAAFRLAAGRHRATLPPMPDPVLRSEGNLRFAGVARSGYAHDAEALVERVRSLMEAQPGVACYGPVSLLFTLPPHGHPETWECQVGLAVTGLPRPVQDVQVEDYHALQAAVLPHAGPIRDLDSTHRRLVEHVRTLGHVVRPYWRVALARKRLADGNVLPLAEVAVFVDRF